MSEDVTEPLLPCARCGHPAICHDTNYIERGPCWKCVAPFVCQRYLMPLTLVPAPPPAPAKETP